MIHKSTSTTINRPAAEVFAVVADVTRMGEWSPECKQCRWVAPFSGPAVGALFEGDNVASLGPVTLKKWTTTSEVTTCVPGEVFEFVAEGYTTWRYDLTEENGVTTLTESFSHADYTGKEKFLYDTLMHRSDGMRKGMDRTLQRMKAALEA